MDRVIGGDEHGGDLRRKSVPGVGERRLAGWRHAGRAQGRKSQGLRNCRTIAAQRPRNDIASHDTQYM